MQSLIALLNGHPTVLLSCSATPVWPSAIGLGARALWSGWADAVSGAKLFRPHWNRGIAFLLALGATVVLFRLPARPDRPRPRS